MTTGGAGFDIFSVAPAAPTLDPSNTTTITDFEAGIDVIVLGTAIPFDVLATAQQLGADVHIVDDHGKVLILLDTQIADIPESTFIFQNPFVITGSEGADVLTGGGLAVMMCLSGTKETTFSSGEMETTSSMAIRRGLPVLTAKRLRAVPATINCSAGAATMCLMAGRVMISSMETAWVMT
jgi:hypothetical protein